MLDLAELTRHLTDLTDDELAEVLHDAPQIETLLRQAQAEDQRAMQLAYYTVANPPALRIHQSTAREIAVVGGNRSGKTDHALAELAIQCSGVVPESLKASYPREKLRAPIRARIICNSLTDTLEPVIKPKLRWDQWNGVGAPQDDRGHWGWIPRTCLLGGSWEKAYSERYRTLHVAVECVWQTANGYDAVSGVSTIQMLSYDQDLSAHTGASLHLIVHDELPPSDVYRESRMRTLDVRGQIITAFTPPDEIGASHGDVTWFYDEVYEPGLPGPHQHPSVETVQLWTEKNRILSAADIHELSTRMTEAQREVRLFGKFIHLSGAIFPLFEKAWATWCARCEKRILPVNGTCPTCTSDNVFEYTHRIEPFPVPASWPIVFVIDPHPRKPDAIGWFAITPSDDVIMVANLAIDGTAGEVKRAIDEVERSQHLHPVKRLMDPNIATETNDKLKRGWTLRKAYDDVGLRCDLANDEMNVGIETVNEWLKPDAHTRKPRFQCFDACAETIHAMSRWAWDDWSRSSNERDPKERPRERHKDWCDLVRYCLMDRPTFTGYTMGAAFRHRRTRR